MIDPGGLIEYAQRWIELHRENKYQREAAKIMQRVVDALVSVRAERDAALADLRKCEDLRVKNRPIFEQMRNERTGARRERDAALARIAELEAEVTRVAKKFVIGEGEAWQCKKEQYERAERAEARIAEAAKLHRPDWSDWGIDHPEEGASCSCGVNYAYEECPTRIALGLDEGENDDL